MSQARLTHQVTGCENVEDAEIAWAPDIADLVTAVVWDQHYVMAQLSRENLRTFGMTLARAFDRALTNFRLWNPELIVFAVGRGLPDGICHYGLVEKHQSSMLLLPCGGEKPIGPAGDVGRPVSGSQFLAARVQWQQNTAMRFAGLAHRNRCRAWCIPYALGSSAPKAPSG